MLLYFHKKTQDRHHDHAHQEGPVAQELIYKYISYSIATNGIVLIIFLAPLLWFYNQNYETVKSVAYDAFPTLLVHLEQETRWLMFFSALCFLSILGFSAIWTYRTCKDLSASLNKIQDHMKGVFTSHGLKHDFEVAEEDALKNFASSYESFVYNLKEETLTELYLLEKLNVDPSRTNAHKAWMDLIQIKKDRLGMSSQKLKLIISTASGSDAAAPPRRVS